MFHAFFRSGKKVTQSGRALISHFPNIFAGFVGAATAGGTVVYADTIIEIIHGENKVMITSGDDGYPVDLDYPPHGVSDTLKGLPDWIKRGCGDERYYCPVKNAIFSPDGLAPDKMPDLSKHNSLMADVLNETPSLWDLLKNRITKTGVSLSDCIKTGVDNPGHGQKKNVGVVAADEESYKVFKELFDPVIDLWHGGYSAGAIQPTNMDINHISDTDVDPASKYVLSTSIRTGRSVTGFQLSPSISFEDRRKLEKIVVGALLQMEGDLNGEYFPLNGSRSWVAMPKGMSKTKEAELRRYGDFFQELDSTLMLASGMARHWPDARGVFHNHEKNLFICFGQEDHIQIVSVQGDQTMPSDKGKQIKEISSRFIRACDAIQKVLKEDGYDFVHNEHLGWVLTCPSNLGTGLRCGVMARLPHVSSRSDWKTLVESMRLQVRGKGEDSSTSPGGVWDVSNSDRIGKGEIDILNNLIEGIAQLVKWETMFDSGKAPIADREIKRQISSAREASSL